MINLKDVVWSEVDITDEIDINGKDDSVSVMSCCGFPPPDEGLRCWINIPLIATWCPGR